MKKGPDFFQSSPALVGIPPSSAYEKTALCLIRAVISVGWQSIFGCFIVYPFVHRRNKETIAAMLEAERIAKDPSVKGYNDLDELFADLKK